MGFGAATFTRFASEGWWALQDSKLQPDRSSRSSPCQTYAGDLPAGARFLFRTVADSVGPESPCLVASTGVCSPTFQRAASAAVTLAIPRLQIPSVKGTITLQDP